MSELAMTIIDVGWGDSILIESTDNNGRTQYALVDCNDYEYERSAFIFVKRHFQRKHEGFESIRHNFKWVLLTHGHADHARGMRRMMSTYGTKFFWYPKSLPSTTQSTLLSYSNRSSKVGFHQAIDQSKDFSSIDFGDVTMQALWPDHDQIHPSNENRNSVVMALTLGQVTFVLTGDAEADVWTTIGSRLPTTTRVFQAPHHGALNGMFTSNGATPWLDQLGTGVRVAMSSHLRPHGHPHPDVIARLNQHSDRVSHFRTDEHYHLTFRTDGSTVEVQYSHV